MPNTHTWIVVANSSTAKIFKLVKFPEIEEIHAFEHPESRLHNQDLVTDREGRSFQSIGFGRSAYQPETEPKMVEIQKFATLISHFLTASHQNGEFTRLYLLASPAFLGLLRQRMDLQTQKAIVAESPKDLTDHKKEEIEEHLAAL